MTHPGHAPAVCGLRGSQSPEAGWVINISTSGDRPLLSPQTKLNPKLHSAPSLPTQAFLFHCLPHSSGSCPLGAPTPVLRALGAGLL